jgi:hypothetical protein
MNSRAKKVINRNHLFNSGKKTGKQSNGTSFVMEGSIINVNILTYLLNRGRFAINYHFKSNFSKYQRTQAKPFRLRL